MHQTLKPVLSTLCQGHSLGWPKLLASSQVVMNQAMHTTTGQQPYFAFFSRHPPWLAGAALPTVEGEEDEMVELDALTYNTHQKMSRRYRDTANRKRKGEHTEVGSLVWVRHGTTNPGTCRKMTPRWQGVYHAVEVVMDGCVHVLENLLMGKGVK